MVGRESEGRREGREISRLTHHQFDGSAIQKPASISANGPFRYSTISDSFTAVVSAAAFLIELLDAAAGVVVTATAVLVELS